MNETSVFRNGQFWRPLAIGLGSLVVAGVAAWIVVVQVAAGHVTRPEMMEAMDREHRPIVEVMEDIRDEQKTMIEDVQEIRIDQVRITEKLRIPKRQ